MDRKRLALGVAALTAAGVTVARLRRRPAQPDFHRPAPYSHRVDQPEIVEEWGVESFPASDPPQSW